MKSIKHIFGKIFGRFTITVVIILVQAAWFALLVLRLGEYAEYFEAGFTLLAALLVLFVIYRDDTGAYKLGWTLLILLIPVFGALMYLFFGNKRPSRRIREKLNPVIDSHKNDLKQVYKTRELQSSRLQRTVDYIADKGPFPAWDGTVTKYYKLGDDAFPDLLEDLRRAEHFIFLEYFIVAQGRMWDEVHEILKEKAAAGVDVRLIYDDVGSMGRVPMGFASKLEAEKIKTVVFNPLRPILSLVYNNRDHRKICIVDGYIAHSGGYNIADEYINEYERFGHWKDSGIRIEGEGVWNFTVTFLDMWNAFRPTEGNYQSFGPHVYHPGVFDSDGIVQPFSDSPLDDENLGENVYMEIINQAEDYVYIFTPYLILDNEMISCITLAAKRGVDVRIVTPRIPDKKIIFRLTRSYYRPLIEGGVKIYEYTPGFIHAKSFIADGKIGVVGTINLDYRSLYLHFECGTMMIGSKALRGLKDDCEETIKISNQIELSEIRQGFFGVLMDSFLRVLSPLL